MYLPKIRTYPWGILKPKRLCPKSQSSGYRIRRNRCLRSTLSCGGYSMVTDGSDGVYVRILYPYATPPTRMIDVNRKRAR